MTSRALEFVAGPGGAGLTLHPEWFKTPQQGVATPVWAATSPPLDGIGGVCLADCDIAEPATEGSRTGVKEWAVDPAQAARLWELSAELDALAA
ncbi:hypothetical protein ACGFYA_24390 [Streptomyces sp. NPDC048305]|uniref:hypothetical protein n=1 Tax=Streptomyces sp. NPDC048305 TaxID=3365532 RepID=UPI0037141210